MTTLQQTPLDTSGSPSESEPRVAEVPVLIRLPDLQTVRSDVPREDVASGSQAISLPGVESPSEASEQDAGAKSSAVAAPKRRRFRLVRHGRTRVRAWMRRGWSPPQIPRPVRHAGILVGVVGLVVACYLVVNGNRSEEQPSSAEPTELVENDPLSPPEDPLRMSMLPLLPPAPGGTEERSERDQTPIGLPIPFQQRSPDSTAATPLVAETTTPSESLKPAEESEADAPRVAEVPVIGEDAPDASAAPESENTAPAAAEPNTTEVVAAPDAGQDSPAAPEATSEQESVDEAVVITYPTTNPATFQYPADYHLRLAPNQQPGLRQTEPSPEGGSLYQWPANTARLQPRIEPPPIR
jgi:hypothetical protein